MCIRDRARLDEQDERAEPHGAAHRPDIGARGAIEEAVEAPEKPAEQQIDHTGRKIALHVAVVGLQEHTGKRLSLIHILDVYKRQLLH